MAEFETAFTPFWRWLELALSGTGAVPGLFSQEDTIATSTPLPKSYFIRVGKTENKINLC